MSKPLTPSHNMPLPDNEFLGKFCRVPYVDIIFRTSDSQYLRAQKSYVVDSSPVLGELITVKTRHGSGTEGEPHPMNCLMKIEIMNDTYPSRSYHSR